MDNPLLELDSLPPFDRISAAHARPAIEAVLRDNRAALAALTSQAAPTFQSLVVPVEEMSYRLSRVWSPVSHLNGVANSPEIRAAYNECIPLLTDYASQLGQNTALKAGFEYVLAHEGDSLSAESRRVVTNALRDFRLAGIDLPAAAQARFRELQQELARVGTRFAENVLDSAAAYTRLVDSEAGIAGLPANMVARAAADAAAAGRPGWLFRLDQPTYMTVLSTADDEELRQDIYRAWVTRASAVGPGGERFDNGPLIEDILRLRHELAGLLGMHSYAQLALATRMAKDVGQVQRFLAELGAHCHSAGQREFADLEAFAGRPLKAWDVAYYREKLQASRFQVSQEELRSYFPLPKVLGGLFALTERLYGIRVRERPQAVVWHPSVRYYDLTDQDGAIVAGFYLDPYSRTEKRGGAWMDECIVAKSLPTGRALPVAQLVCNFTAPVGSQPALLTHAEVTTLFHEFGHGLHHMLTRVAYPSIAGINGVSWDAVELPSQFMENFVWRAEVLPLISAHQDSGEPLPAALLERLLGTRTFCGALDTLRQVELATFDFNLHADYDPALGGRVAATLQSVRERYAVVPAPAFSRVPSSFSHIFAGGYAAGYYSYKWAEVLAADAFAAFEEAGIFDAATAARFRDSVLARGGSIDAMEAFVRFRGREPDVRALLRQTGIAA